MKEPSPLVKQAREAIMEHGSQWLWPDDELDCCLEIVLAIGAAAEQEAIVNYLSNYDHHFVMNDIFARGISEASNIVKSGAYKR